MSLRLSDRATRPKRRKIAGTGGRTAAIFLTPFFALFLVAMIAPVIYAIGMSLFAERRSGLGFGGSVVEFVGLGNYVDVLSSETFVAGFGRLALYCLMYIPTLLGVALLFALLLDAAVTVA